MPFVRTSAALLVALLSASLLAQQPTIAELQQRRSDKLQKPVFQRNGWSTDFDAARAAARQGNKPVFAYFTRSYSACAPCDVLENGELSSEAFARFAKQVVLFLHCSSHTPDEPMPRLATDRGFTSYPTLCFFDADGELLARLGADDKTVTAFEQALAKVVELQTLRGRAANDADAGKRCFLLQVQLDALTLAEMQQKSQQFGNLTPAEKASVDARITDALLDDVLQRRELGPQGVGQRLAELAKAGHRPSASKTNLFWNPVLTHARDTRDTALAQQAYDALVSQYGKDRRFERAMQSWRQQLTEAGGK